MDIEQHNYYGFCLTEEIKMESTQHKESEVCCNNLEGS